MPIDAYYNKFLPFLECYAWCEAELGVPTPFYNKEAFGKYLEISRKTSQKYFGLAEQSGFITLTGKSTKVSADVTTEWALCSYRTNFGLLNKNLDSLGIANYFSEGEKFRDFYKFLNCQEDISLSPIEIKDKAERVAYYQETCKDYTNLLAETNALKPERLKSFYLDDGLCRETNFLCTTKNPEKHPEDTKRVETIVTCLGIPENLITETDIKSSIYRDAYALSRGKLLPHKTDVYAEVWNKAFKKKLTPELRPSFKQLLMPIFMADGKSIGYWSNLACGKLHDPNANEDTLNGVRACSAYLGLRAQEFLTKTESALADFLGVEHFMGSEIFIHESNTHILMMNEFWKNGLSVQNVYDGFYHSKKEISSKEILMAHDKALTTVMKQRRRAV